MNNIFSYQETGILQRNKMMVAREFVRVGADH